VNILKKVTNGASTHIIFQVANKHGVTNELGGYRAKMMVKSLTTDGQTNPSSFKITL
jgi:hypothetical protein